MSENDLPDLEKLPDQDLEYVIGILDRIYDDLDDLNATLIARIGLEMYAIEDTQIAIDFLMAQFQGEKERRT